MINQIKTRFDKSIITYREAAWIQKKVAAGCFSRVPQKTYFRVLEIGAGGGLLTDCCLNRLKSPDVYVALDISKMMLKLVPSGKAVLIQADGEHMPFKRESFDLMISSSAMQWYQDGPSSILKNIKLLQKKGVYSLAVFVQGTFRQMEYAGQLTGFGSLYPMTSARVYVDAFNASGLFPQWTVEDYTQYHPCVPDFLKSHKKTGATYTRPGAKVGRKAYNDFCRIYEKEFREKDGVPASYKVLYLWGKR